MLSLTNALMLSAWLLKVGTLNSVIHNLFVVLFGHFKNLNSVGK